MAGKVKLTVRLHEDVIWVQSNKLNVNEIDYGRWNEWDWLWQIKWMRLTVADEMNEMDCGLKKIKWNMKCGLTEMKWNMNSEVDNVTDVRCYTHMLIRLCDKITSNRWTVLNNFK